MINANLHAIEGTEFGGRVVRLAMLMTHYRQPLDWTSARLNEAERMLRRFLAAAQPSDAVPPVEFIEALCDDMNTPKALAVMHRLRRERRGDDLWACMSWLGLVPGSMFREPDEMKTDPGDFLCADGNGVAL